MLAWVKIGAQIVTADAGFALGCEDVLGGEGGAFVEPCPDGRLRNAMKPSEGGLTASEFDCALEGGLFHGLYV